jgi:hypothetical protein
LNKQQARFFFSYGHYYQQIVLSMARKCTCLTDNDGDFHGTDQWMMLEMMIGFRKSDTILFPFLFRGIPYFVSE